VARCQLAGVCVYFFFFLFLCVGERTDLKLRACVARCSVALCCSLRAAIAQSTPTHTRPHSLTEARHTHTHTHTHTTRSCQSARKVACCVRWIAVTPFALCVVDLAQVTFCHASREGERAREREREQDRCACWQGSRSVPRALDVSS
jgi:hypothetical protein